ncbi:hypothetical protein IE53DRAFT_361544 [Violaceomyces palustris]|uniref:Uncharacterized protein n=1 Tax=Violaceomyces palustris TaxID=1673888 RepID=A0ACD0P0E1_9BASI|nr:hypothetical protein IE53DRAFT_361544 [Violaceomyces palustris]
MKRRSNQTYTLVILVALIAAAVSLLGRVAATRPDPIEKTLEDIKKCNLPHEHLRINQTGDFHPFEVQVLPDELWTWFKRKYVDEYRWYDQSYKVWEFEHQPPGMRLKRVMIPSGKTAMRRNTLALTFFSVENRGSYGKVPVKDRRFYHISYRKRDGTWAPLFMDPFASKVLEVLKDQDDSRDRANILYNIVEGRDDLRQEFLDNGRIGIHNIDPVRVENYQLRDPKHRLYIDHHSGSGDSSSSISSNDGGSDSDHKSAESGSHMDDVRFSQHFNRWLEVNDLRGAASPDREGSFAYGSQPHHHWSESEAGPSGRHQEFDFRRDGDRAIEDFDDWFVNRGRGARGAGGAGGIGGSQGWFHY